MERMGDERQEGSDWRSGYEGMAKRKRGEGAGVGTGNRLLERALSPSASSCNSTPPITRGKWLKVRRYGWMTVLVNEPTSRYKQRPLAHVNRDTRMVENGGMKGS